MDEQTLFYIISGLGTAIVSLVSAIVYLFKRLEKREDYHDSKVEDIIRENKEAYTGLIKDSQQLHEKSTTAMLEMKHAVMMNSQIIEQLNDLIKK